MSDAGLKQSQAYTASLHKLAEAEKNLDDLLDGNFASLKDIQTAKDRLIAAKAERNVAYKAYTNPFGVKKTV